MAQPGGIYQILAALFTAQCTMHNAECGMQNAEFCHSEPMPIPLICHSEEGECPTWESPGCNYAHCTGRLPRVLTHPRNDMVNCKIVFIIWVCILFDKGWGQIVYDLLKTHKVDKKVRRFLQKASSTIALFVFVDTSAPIITFIVLIITSQVYYLYLVISKY